MSVLALGGVMFFSSFSEIFDTPWGVFALLLSLGVIFVNGFTDAPNAIASSVCSGAVSMKSACLISAVCNFVGVFLISIVNSSVAKCVFSLAGFDGPLGICAFCASFASIIIFGVVAWYFGMPSSESHAMIASLAGASLALHASFSTGEKFLQIIVFTILSSVFAFALSYFSSKLFKKDRLPYRQLQVLSCVTTSFMHGAQDGQKFIGVMLFLISFGEGSVGFSVPVSLILTVSTVMAIGTSLGGGRIIKSLGENTVKLDFRRGFVSDACASVSLFFSSLLGFPVSTSNIKACSVIGAGVSDREKVNKKTAFSVLAVSVITFPVCFMLGYLLTLLFVSIY